MINLMRTLIIICYTFNHFSTIDEIFEIPLVQSSGVEVHVLIAVAKLQSLPCLVSIKVTL